VVVLTNASDALGICVDYKRHLANMIKPKYVANVSLQLILRANIEGGGQSSLSLVGM